MAPVLLDKFLTAMAESREAFGQVNERTVAGLAKPRVHIEASCVDGASITVLVREQEEAIENNPAADEEHCLDPLMEVLSKYRSLEDLVMSVTIIFHRLDLDGSGGLGYDELHDVSDGLVFRADVRMTDVRTVTFAGSSEVAADEFHSRGLV